MVCGENVNDNSISFIMFTLLPFKIRVHYSPASSAKVKNGGAMPPFLHASSWHNN
jgi:hypothetical protein